MDSNPIHHLSPGIKWNAYFCIMFNLWWSAGPVNWFEPHLPPLSSKKNEMLIFGLCSTSDDRLGWSMDSNPIHHPSPAQKMKCLFLDYVQLLMIGQAGQWTQTPSATPLQPKNEMLIFGLHSLLMIGQAGQWTRTPSATPLQPKKWYAHFWIMFNLWWSARLAEGLQPNLQPPFNQKMKCLFLYYVIVQMISWAGWWTQRPSTTPKAKKMKCSFLYYVQLLMISRAGQWTRTPSTTLV